MKNIQKKDLQAKLDTLIKSSNPDDEEIARVLMLKNAGSLDKDFIVKYLKSTVWQKDDYVVKIKKKVPGFNILEDLFK